MKNLDFVAKATLATTVILLPQIILPNVGGTGLMLHFNMLICIGLGVFIGLAVYRALAHGELVLPSAWRLLLLALCLFLLPSIYEGLDLTYLGVGAAGIGVALFFLALFQFRDVVTCRFVLTIIIATAAFQALIGLAQLNGIAAGLDGAIEIAGSSNPIGSFQQRNLFGSYVLTGMLALALVALSSQLSAGYRGLLGFGVVCLGLMVALSLSRTAWISAFISFALLIYTLRPAFTVKGATLAVIALVAVVYAAFVTIEDFRSLASNILSRLALGDEPRAIIYSQVLDMIKDNPWIGYGRGDFESAYMHYTAARNYTDPAYPGAPLTNLTHPHNEFLYWWAEGGILPVISIVLLLFVFLRLFVRASRYQSAYFVLLVPIAMHAMLELPLKHSFAHVAVLVLVAYMLMRLVEPDSLKVIHFRALKRSAVMLGFITFLMPALYMVNAFHNVIVLTIFSERPAKYSYLLENIVYPANQNTALNYFVYTEVMKYALVNNDEKRAKIFFSWAEQELAYRPRLGLIKNLAYSYQAFGYEQEAERTASLLSYYFVDSKQLYTDQVVFGDASTK